MEYKIHFLALGDADAIVIKYKQDVYHRWITVLVDAGNEGDGAKIKPYLDRAADGMHQIDYAFCTHPDKDHKGGFFDLLEDPSVRIREMYLFNPWQYLESCDFVRVASRCAQMERAIDPFQSPSDESKNLIEMAEDQGILCQATQGLQLDDIPLTILGPSDDYYRQCALGMVEEFAELKDDPDFEKYDENTFMDDNEAQSVIDEIEDESYTNKSSMVLLFHPSDEEKFLLPGDAACSSLQEMVECYGKILGNCILKVPHHGSKHNLTTALIDALRPRLAIISAKGNKKHPNAGIVYWLSKYCDVYSTHKSGTLTYSPQASGSPADPLKRKMPNCRR